MEALMVLIIGVFGLIVFCKAIKHDWEEWHYGRLNRRTFERWSKERYL